MRPTLPREGADILIRVGQADERATVTLGPFYDPDGERLKGMSRLAFLSPSQAEPGVAVVSPLRRMPSAPASTTSRTSASSSCAAPLDAVEPAPGEELLRLRPGLGLLVTGEPAAALARLEGPGVRAYDMTAALAAFEFTGDDVLRRLTELDPASFPTAGSIARGTRAVFDDRGGGRYRVFVAQELGHYVAEVVLDVLRGLGR